LIPYDRTRWWRTAFSFHGTVLPQTLGRVGLFTLFCLGLCFLNDHFLKNHGLELPALDQLGHTVMGVTMSLLIVHRTTSSNIRFWEGRTAWGAMVNASRNVARQAGTYAPPADEVARLLAAFAIAVRERLRDRDPTEALRPWLSGRLLEDVVTASSPPARLARSLSQWVHARKAQGALDAITAAEIERQIAALTDAQGASEKIQHTPLPFIYSSLIKQLLILYLASLPFVVVAKMGYAAPLVVAVVALGMLGIEEAGVEIENPFGPAPNSLPLETICANIARDCAELARSEN
jgi:putative membrane protein